MIISVCCVTVETEILFQRWQIVLAMYIYTLCTVCNFRICWVIICNFNLAFENNEYGFE